jgi:hypothetical protein
MTFLKYSLLLLLVGCGSKGVRFDPDFYVGDHRVQGIVSERGDVVPAAVPLFDEFACMHKTKIRELKALLIRLKVPKGARAKIHQEYQNLVDRLTLP